LTGSKSSDAGFSGAAGAVSIYLATNTTLQGTNPSNGDFDLELHLDPALPADSNYRKIGTATWDGASDLSAVALTNGVYADANQNNSFVFRSILNKTTEIPLTIYGRSAQNTAASKMFSVGYESGGYQEKFYLSSLGRIVTKQTLSTDLAYQVFLGSDANPMLAISGAGIAFGAGGGSATDVSITRTAANTIALATGDKIQSDVVPTAANDLVNKTYSEEGHVKVNAALTTGTLYPVLTTDHVIPVNYVGDQEVQLPAIPAAGKVYIVVDSGGNASATDKITVSTVDSALIMGQATYEIASAYGSAGFISDGTNWMVY
jgi:sorbitol-specific phosphotransferase system component IIA